MSTRILEDLVGVGYAIRESHCAANPLSLWFCSGIAWFYALLSAKRKYSVASRAQYANVLKDPFAREQEMVNPPARTHPYLLRMRDRPMGEKFASSTRAREAVCLSVMLALTVLAHPASSRPASGSEIVQGLYDTLLSTMQNGRTLGQSGRFVRLEPVIRRTFDVPTMARLSVGSTWAGLTESQRQQITESFGRYISALYADRFDSYSGEKLQITGEQPIAAGVIVHSQIVKENEEPVKVDYLMRRNGDAWLISDIYLDSAISEVATRRSEFGAILKSQGIEGLITALNRKAAMLTGTTAQAF
jgi:phospholipid transport system substrate-binding protein